HADNDERKRPGATAADVDEPVEGSEHPQRPAGTKDGPRRRPNALDGRAEVLVGQRTHGQAEGAGDDKPEELGASRARGAQPCAGHEAEDHRGHRRDEVERLVAAAVEVEWLWAGEEVK